MQYSEKYNKFKSIKKKKKILLVLRWTPNYFHIYSILQYSGVLLERKILLCSNLILVTLIHYHDEYTY